MKSPKIIPTPAPIINRAPSSLFLINGATFFYELSVCYVFGISSRRISLFRQKKMNRKYLTNSSHNKIAKKKYPQNSPNPHKIDEQFAGNEEFIGTKKYFIICLPIPIVWWKNCRNSRNCVQIIFNQFSISLLNFKVIRSQLDIAELFACFLGAAGYFLGISLSSFCWCLHPRFHRFASFLGIISEKCVFVV